MNKIHFFVIFIWCIFTVNSIAQNNITFNQLKKEDGLSHSSVTCIFQDKIGFMWFGTQDGLNRYDGYNFKIFKNSPGDSTSLSDNFIFSIGEDESGNLFIVTQSGKINLYNPVLESFLIISADSINFYKARMNSVSAIFYDKSDIVWSGGSGKETGLRMENKKSGEIKIYLHSADDEFSLSDNKVYSILRDSRGILWIGTSNGLDKLDENTGKFEHYRNIAGNPQSLSDNWVWNIQEDSKGNLWIGTYNGGLNKFDPITNIFTSYKNNPKNNKSISDNWIFSIYEDKSGLIWAGTNAGGVNYIDPSTKVFEHYFKIDKNKNSLSDNTVMSMYVDKEGYYWIGTKNGGLDKFDYDKKKFVNYSHNPSNPNSLLSNSVTEILEDNSGILWIGTFNSGLNSFNPRSGVFKSYIHNPLDSNSITDNRIYAINEDIDGIIWIGTYAGGLNRLDKNNGRITNYKFSENDSLSISSNNVWSMQSDSIGNLWIGTFGGGLNFYDKSTNSFKHFKNDPEDSESLVDDNVIRTFIDSKDNIWVGTTSGLCLLNKENNKFKTYNVTDGLSNNFIYGILEDDGGNLWLSTNDGLSKFDPVKEIFSNFYVEDGLQNNEFNQSAFAKDFKTGNLLFGGVNGFNVFNPDRIIRNKFIPQIAFTNFIRYNTESIPILGKGISEKKEITLTHTDNIVTLEFASLSYYNSFKNQYKYKLEGFNNNWIQLQTDNKVTLTNLSPGDYVLKVIGSNNDGVWNEEGASLSIIVLPPWWRSNFAYSFYALFILGSLYSIRRFEINRREQKSKLREAELSMKATEAEKRALKIENDRKSQELEEARQLQLSMLPKVLPKLPHLEIAAFMRTATEVGGDYYDFNVQDNGILNIAFGDATGHGLQAGTMVTLMKGFFISDSARLGIKEFMNHCSKLIKQIKIGRILMCFNFLKIDKNKIKLSGAAMPPIYFYNCESGTIDEVVMKGMPLGAIANFPYEMYERQLSSGDTILLISDGLPEQMNHNQEMYDYQRVKDQFLEVAQKKTTEIINHLVESCDNWKGSEIQEDDISIVVIKIL